MDTLCTSTLITRMTSDINQVQSGLNLFLRLFLRSPFVVIGAMVMAFTVNSRAALIFVVTIPLLSVVAFGIMAATRPLYKTVQNRLDRVLGLTREKASELLETIAPERIEKIENERTVPRPDEVLTMAEKYKRPALCNYYCSRQCPIGREYVPQVSVRELSAIVLEMLASLNAMDKKKERLIEITADGQISSDEIDDFIRIRQELERISVTVETLQLWTERMLANGQIDAEAYKAKLGE